MSYEVRVTRSAEKQLRKLDRQVQTRLLLAAQALGDDPRPSKAEPMEADRQGYWRLRITLIGIHFRIIYSIDDTIEIVEVVQIGTREGAY
jgi:mRNA interferase RelE/StbE